MDKPKLQLGLLSVGLVAQAAVVHGWEHNSFLGNSIFSLMVANKQNYNIGQWAITAFIFSFAKQWAAVSAILEKTFIFKVLFTFASTTPQRKQGPSAKLPDDVSILVAPKPNGQGNVVGKSTDGSSRIAPQKSKDWQLSYPRVTISPPTTLWSIVNLGRYKNFVLLTYFFIFLLKYIRKELK